MLLLLLLLLLLFFHSAVNGCRRQYVRETAAMEDDFILLSGKTNVKIILQSIFFEKYF